MRLIFAYQLAFDPPKGSSARYRVGVRSEEVRRPRAGPPG